VGTDVQRGDVGRALLAAAILTTPLPVLRSNICRPAETAALVTASIRSHESSRIMLRRIGAVGRNVLAEDSVTAAVIEDSRRLGGAMMCVVG
jgi:hypothetical protein